MALDGSCTDASQAVAVVRAFALGGVAWLLAWTVVGCGTMCNMKGGYLMGPRRDGYPAPYGGLALHAEHIVEYGRGFTSDPILSVFGSMFILADLPLTTVGDTVTLPWVLMHREDDPAETQPLPQGIVPAGAPTVEPRS